MNGVSRNNIGIGFLPDSDNGQNMANLIKGLGIKVSFYGWYAQVSGSGTWDGSQLTSQLDDVKSSGAIFQPAVMPTGGWTGFTTDDNSQALAVAAVMKKFTDEGIEVWLRFAHEVNWYQSDGTYKGSADDFKTGWATVAAAVKDNDKVKMFFTPNVADMTAYEEYYPTDPTTVDIIGIDYYPKSGVDFLGTMQDFHDKYCGTTDGHTTYFAIGETGQAYVTDIATRLSWLNAMTESATAKAMPYLIGVSWFNYLKEEDYRLYDPDNSTVNDATKSWMTDSSNDVSASGVVVGA